MASKEEEIKSLDTLFRNLTKSIKETGVALQKSLESKGTSETLDDIKKLENEIDELNESTKVFQQTQKQQATQQAKLNSLRKGEQKELIKTRLKLQEETKAVKDSIKARQSLTPQYDKARKKLAGMQNALVEARLGETKMSASTKKLAKDVARLNNQISGAEQLGGRFQRQVARYPKLLSGAALAAGGAFIGFQQFTRVLGDAVNIAKDFEQSNANLAAVLGVSRGEMGALTEDAKRLGAATSFSATEVSGLQTEFAKLGFNQQEILDATEATLNLAAATGSDLGEAAAIAGATLGGFGLGAEETARVTDVMAKSFSTSALDMEKFKESMKDAAPAAKAVGVDVEKTTALLGRLSNAGISGSKAGTALKAGFIELNAAGITLDESLEKISNSQNKLATATELVGKRAATSFLVLADGTDEIAELEKGLRNAGGAAERMANEQLDTLEGSLKILNSAWEGFVLSLLSGEGAFSSVSRGIVSATTSLLGFLTTSEEINKEWLNQRDNIESLNVQILENSDRHDELAEKTELTKDEQIELDEIIQQLAKDVPTAVTEFDKYGKALAVSTTATREFAEQQKNLLLVTNADEIRETEKAIKDLTKQQERQNDLYKQSSEGLQIYDRELEKATNGSIKFRDATLEENVAFTKKTEKIAKLIDGNVAYLAQLKGEKTDAEKAAKAEGELTKEIIDNTKAKKGLTDAQKAYNKSLKEQISLLKEQQKEELLLAGDSELLKLNLRDEHLNQINELELKFIGQTSTEKKKINAKLNNDLLSNDISRVKKQAEIEKKSQEEKDKLEKQALKDANAITQFRLDRAVKDAETIDDIENTSIEAAENRAEIRKQQAELSADDLILIEEQLQAEIADIQKKADEDRLTEQKKADKEALEEQKKLTDAAIKIIENGLKKRSDARLEELDKELSDSEGQRDRLQKLADAGDENAIKSLQAAQLQEAAIRKEAAKEVAAQKRNELILAGIKAYTANGDVPKTLGDLTTLIAGLNDLPIPGFWDGADTVSDTLGAPQLSGRDGHIVRVDGKEQVHSEKDRKDMSNPKTGKFRTREELKNIVNLHDKGIGLNNITLPNYEIKNERFSDNEAIIELGDKLEKAIKHQTKNMPTSSAMFDEFIKAMRYTQKKGNQTKVTNHLFD